MNARVARRAAAIVAVCTLAGGSIALNHALVGVFYDDGLYAGIAVALAHGQGYVHPHLPGTPAVIHYPPVYPLVLAPLYAVLSVATAGFAGKILNLVFGVVAAALITWHALRSDLLGDTVPPWIAPACVVAAALAIPVLTVQSVLFAEPLFALLLVSTVICADRLPGREAGRNGDLWAGLTGIGGALALLTRTIGVAAGIGVVLFLAWRRVGRRRLLFVALPVGLAAAGWAAWTLVHRSGIDPALAINYGSYGEVLRQTGLGAFGTSAVDLVRPLGALTLGWLPFRAAYLLIGATALGVTVYGGWLLIHRSAIGLTLLGYFAILAVWPFASDRFVWAVLPWIALAGAAGAIAIHRRAPRARLALAIPLAAVVVGYLQYQARGVAGRWWGSQELVISSNFAELLPGLDSLPAGSVLATDDEALVWLYARGVTVPFYLYGFRGGQEVRPGTAAHRAYLERMGVTHVLFSGYGSGSDTELNDLLGAYPGWLTPVRLWRGGRALFRVTRTAH